MLTQDGTSIGINEDDGTLAMRLGQVALWGRCYAVLEPRDSGTLRVWGQKVETIDLYQVSDAHGSGRRIAVHYAPAEGGLATLLQASIYDHHRFIALRVGIENRGPSTVRALVLSPLATKRFTTRHFLRRLAHDML
jgi:hypothetical protein